MYIHNVFSISRDEYAFIHELYFKILIGINTPDIKMNSYLLLALYYMM